MTPISRILTLKSLDALPRAVARHLVDMLYAQAPVLAIGAAAMLLVALLAYLRTGSEWFLLWAGLSVILTVIRLLLHRAYRRRNGHGSPRLWAQRALAWSWAAGALWGSAGVAVARVPDPYVYFLIVAVQTGYVMGGAVRATAVPTVAIGQNLLILTPTLVACLLAEDPFTRCVAVFVAIYLGASISITRAFSAMTMRLLLADEEKSRQLLQITAAKRELETQAGTDALTGVANRRAFDAALLRGWRRGARDQVPTAVLLIDVDFFKKYNDHFGHQAGDACLQWVARAIEGAVRRPDDTIARYGGEEFAAILPNTDGGGALHLGERVRAAVESLQMPHPGNPSGRVTISVGCAATVATPGVSAQALIRLADVALYEAKRCGRNLVCACPSAASRGAASDPAPHGTRLRHDGLCPLDPNHGLCPGPVH